MLRYILKFLFLSFCFGQNLLNESFDNSNSLPGGWEFIPDSYPTNTGQWQISSWQNDFNANPPSATYYWSPSVPSSFAYPYEGHYLYSPIIYVDSFTNAMISFQIALDGYPSPAGHYNGMNFEYSSDGDEWVSALNYEISAGGETIDIYPRVESFYASMESTLQLRWETYGTNSYYIDAWHIDDISVEVYNECSVDEVNLWDTCFSISNTDSLNLSDSELTGPIPYELTELINLEYLNLSGNNLEDSIPSLQNLTLLNYLNLSENNLNGPIPYGIGSLTNLEYLNLSKNADTWGGIPIGGISGSIPDEIGDLENLLYLNFSQNNLSGSIPSSIGNLQDLDSLDLSMNFQIDWLTPVSGIDSIPPEIGELINLKFLNLSSCFISTFPSEISNLQSLEKLNLSFNRSLASIEYVSIGTDTASSIFNTIFGLTSLKHLNLKNCHLEGIIPLGISNLENLKTLDLNANLLSGELPNDLWGLDDLEILKVGSGNMVPGVLSVVENNFYGNVLDSISTLLNLNSLDLSDNQFSGEIPNSLFNNTSLDVVRLNGNSFSGTVPSIICDFISLEDDSVNILIALNDNMFCAPYPVCLDLPCWIPYTSHEIEFNCIGLQDTANCNIFSQFQPQSKEELQTAVNLWIDDNSNALETYGEINSWDVNLISDMSSLFEDKFQFNDELSNWDVSNVENMESMFMSCTTFNQDLSNWDVSNVLNMQSLFMYAHNFNNNISNWNVSSVTNMAQLFQDAYDFNGDLSQWNVSNTTNMSEMFAGASNFNQDLSSWNVSNVIDMSSMFSHAISFNQQLDIWDVSNVFSMENMFSNASNFDQDLSSWDVSNVIDISSMFSNAISFNQQLDIWDVSNVFSMENMFSNASNFDQDLSSWNVSMVENMAFLFSGCQNFNQDISAWNVSNVTDMKGMFEGALVFDQNLSSWNVSMVENMAFLFSGCQNFNQDVSNWDISNVTEMENMFDNTSLSETNKCIVHTSFSLNSAWPYDWSESCNLINQIDIIAPISFSLNQNYPNPFNPYTTLNYELPEDSFVDITVYDMLGNIVNTLVNANQSSGYKSVQWNATNNQGEPVSAGVYLYKIQAGDFIDTKKMILLK